MSRARVHEVSSPISLFPFIGILLCTMGALLVVLVAVSRSARDSAEEQLQTAHSTAKAEVDVTTQRKLSDARQYIDKLGAIRGEAERTLRNENARLSHVEDHIRRLHDRLRTLQISAEELDSLEQAHFDDREQAERETARLNKLIADSQEAIDALQEAADNEPTSYALVPYDGPNGTFRRPIYIECVKDSLILQPEGIRISASDLRRPIGAGNPLAAALRAARDHLVQIHPKEGRSRETEPYPLLLVRPDGLYMFDRARQAIEAGDFDLGFELVENDWNLKYPLPNPQLASIEQVAVDQARARQEVLAAAAPAFRRRAMSLDGRYGAGDDGFGDEDGSGEFGSAGDYGSEFGGSGEGGGGFGGNSAGNPGSGGGGGATGFAGGGGGSGGSQARSGATMGGGGGGAGGGAATGSDYANGASGGAADASQAGVAGNSSASGAGGNSSGAGNAVGNVGSSISTGSGMPAVATTDPNAQPDSPGTSTSVSAMMGSPPPDADPNAQFDPRGPRDKNQIVPPEHRGKDWALNKKGPRAVPVRRTIRVVVRDDQVSLVSERTANAPAATNHSVVSFHGDTVESVDEFVKQVQREIDGWGIAGNGLYWRPVLNMTIAPDGRERANDLARLLKNSGLELKAEEVARGPALGGSHEAR